MPTLGHEGLPLVPLEAFAAGTPAVVRRFGALEELVEETGAGLSTAPPPSSTPRSTASRAIRPCGRSSAGAGAPPSASASRRRHTWTRYLSSLIVRWRRPREQE